VSSLWHSVLYVDYFVRILCIIKLGSRAAFGLAQSTFCERAMAGYGSKFVVQSITGAPKSFGT